MPARRRKKITAQTITISTATILKLVLVVLGLWLLWYLRDIFSILIAALLLAAIIEPFADWFHARKIPRAVAVVIVYIGLALIITLVTILLVPIVIEQVTQLLTNFTTTYSGFIESFAQLRNFSIELGFEENFRSTMESIQLGITNGVSSLFSTVRGFIGSIVALFVVLVLAFYMIVEEDAARKYFNNLVPAHYKPYITQLFIKIQKRIGAWLRGQIILGLIIGITTYIGLLILDIEYALLLAIIAGLFEIIPYVGPVLSVIPAALLGFAVSPVKGILVLVLYLVVQQIENNILVPKIMQKVTGLNPIISIIALLVGIKAGGLVGAILAIPVAIIVTTVLEDLFSNEEIIHS